MAEERRGQIPEVNEVFSLALTQGKARWEELKKVLFESHMV
jgi:hypothetical protein